MKGLGGTGKKRVVSWADDGEKALDSKSKEEGEDRDKNEGKDGSGKATTVEEKTGKGKESDGIGIDCSARESEEEGGGKEEGNKDKEGGSTLGGVVAGGDEEVECRQGWGEEEVAHELGLDGKTGGVRKAEGLRNTTETKKAGFATDTGEVEKALDPAEEADECTKEKK